MSPKADTPLPLPPSESSFRGKEGDDAIHHEMVAELSEADRAFLDGFTEEQRKKVMWKVSSRYSSPGAWACVLETNHHHDPSSISGSYPCLPSSTSLHISIERTSVRQRFTGHDNMKVLTTRALGNAKIEGLMEDLNLSGTQYNIALSIFFVPYIILGKFPPACTWHP